VTVRELPRRLWSIARKVEDLLELNASTETALRKISKRLSHLENRMTNLEASQGQLIAEARAAAGAAATGLAASIVADIVTRVTRVEMRQDDLQRRLPPPV
jgi:chromosome segregation ATPase